MWTYLLRRLLFAILTIWIVTIISFVVIQLPPGDYVTTVISEMLGQGMDEIPPELEAALRAQYGLDQPMYVQYFKWIRNIITRGDFGYSFVYKLDASRLIWDRLPLTFAIAFSSFLFIWIVSLPVGIYSAVRQYSPGDYVATFLGFIGLATPDFLLALIFLFLSYRFLGDARIGLFSQQYINAPWSMAKFQNMLNHLWIPIIIVGTAGTAALIRTMRANLLDELNKPYVETARSKGVSEAKLLIKYPVRHAMNPFVSTIGWTLPTLISGEALVAIVLNLPTSGPILLESLMVQDMYVAAGFILVLCTLTVIGTFVSDVLLAWLDPRIRLS